MSNPNCQNYFTWSHWREIAELFYGTKLRKTFYLGKQLPERLVVKEDKAKCSQHVYLIFCWCTVILLVILYRTNYWKDCDEISDTNSCPPEAEL